ncbi:MAG: hypothetical protein KGD68_11260 [Candidatus Lokiarchaeota archaeon]|nr:hypothetical protein [Candidatus Lokiarchaeota archaeon]
MKNSIGKVDVSYDKMLNFTATSLLLIWIFIIIFGIFSSLSVELLLNMLFTWFTLTYGTPFLFIASIIGFFPSRSVSISLIDLFKNKQWIKPSKFIKSTLLQLLIASMASFLVIIFYEAYSFTEFFLLFNSFALLFPLEFLVLCVYYYRSYSFPRDQYFRITRVKGAH